MWVHATRLDGVLVVTPQINGGFTQEEQAQLYAEFLRLGELFRIPRQQQPPDIPAFRQYFDETVANLVVTDEARDIADSILNPSIPVLGKLMSPVVTALTTYFLPPSIRDQYGLTMTDRQIRMVESYLHACRAFTSVAPKKLLQIPSRAASANAHELFAPPRPSAQELILPELTSV